MTNVCPNCSKSYELLSKEGFCINCQRAYEIGKSKKEYNPYVIAISVFVSKCITIIALTAIMTFIVFRSEILKSDTFLKLMCNYRGGYYHIFEGQNANFCKLYIYVNGDLSTRIYTEDENSSSYSLDGKKFKIEVHEE